MIRLSTLFAFVFLCGFDIFRSSKAHGRNFRASNKRSVCIKRVIAERKLYDKKILGCICSSEFVQSTYRESDRQIKASIKKLIRRTIILQLGIKILSVPDKMTTEGRCVIRDITLVFSVEWNSIKSS